MWIYSSLSLPHIVSCHNEFTAKESQKWTETCSLNWDKPKSLSTLHRESFSFSNFRRNSAVHSSWCSPLEAPPAQCFILVSAPEGIWGHPCGWNALLASHLFFSFSWLLFIYLLIIKADLLWIFLLYFLSHWQKLCMLYLKAHFILNKIFLFWWQPFF